MVKELEEAILNKILGDDDALSYEERGFKIISARLDTSEQILNVLTRSMVEIMPIDLDFIAKKLESKLSGIKVKIINEVKKSGLQDNEIKEILNNSSNKRNEYDFIEDIEREDYEYLNNSLNSRQEEIENNNRAKNEPLEKKKNFYKPKKDLKNPVKIKTLTPDDAFPTVEGEVFSVEWRGTRREGLTILSFYIYDDTDTVLVRAFVNSNRLEKMQADIKNGVYMRLYGEYQYNTFDRAMAITMKDYEITKKEVKMDDEEEKRVEIHAHTKMSAMQGTIDVKDLVKTLKSWGHRGFCITDVSNLQSYPDLMHEMSDDFKIVWGLEANLRNDKETLIQDYRDGYNSFVVFDIETTGLNPREDDIIEIGAVKIVGNDIVDSFNELINPGYAISDFTTQLTSITNEDLKDKPSFEDLYLKFHEFIKDSILVAHNANFDIGFIKYKYSLKDIEIDNPYCDTLKMSRHVLPELKNHKLDTVASRLGVNLLNHHRAVEDAKATGEIFIALNDIMKKKGEIVSDNDLSQIYYSDKYGNFPALIYAKNLDGLKNLYQLVSISNTKTFDGVPVIHLSDLEDKREGLIIGSEGLKGDLFSYIEMGFNMEDLKKKAIKYDFMEIQPLDNYGGLIKGNRYRSINTVIQNLKEYIKLSELVKIDLIAGGNVYEMVPEDLILRLILARGRGDFRAKNDPPLYLKTTSEMLSGFPYIEESKRREIVIENSNKLFDICENIRPIPKEKFPPIVEGADEDLKNSCYEMARSIYGEELPKIVGDRLDKELGSIISNGYAVMYIIAQKLVKKSEQDGYLVGSRGSVGSSFAATMSGITEVNPLPPHYVCTKCHYSEFDESGEYNVGVDMPNKDCPHCGIEMKKDGYNIPFETFLGFYGDKEPDIDLNFAGEYQSQAHKYVEELFGEGYVFRAGTISTIQDKVGYGYVKNYFEELGQVVSAGEIERLVNKLVGVKKTTGQHPGGIMIVPKTKDIHDFSPIQYPADDQTAPMYTTHFAYSALHSNILKLDILGHDGPTTIKMLEEFTGVNIHNIRFDDEEILKMFSSLEPLGLNSEDIGTTVSTLGIPEFGTDFVMGMLEDTNPKNFSDLIRISGLSHGTDVWLNNAKDLIDNKVCELKDVIATREDIMTYLLQAGMDNSFSFFTMEKVRKGKGLTPEDEEEMNKYDLPNWYIDSCNKIKYMFPKAHAVAYDMLSFRIAWFKLHYPEAFYATYFTTKKADFDYAAIAGGLDAIERRMSEIKLIEKPTAKEQNNYRILQIAKEMYLRGIVCEKADIYNSSATKFKITNGSIIPPLSTIPNLGDQAALSVVEERNKGEFLSMDDLLKRTKLSKTCLQFMKDEGIVEELQETNQISMF
ncbi:MAG: PolC-type DNA polymerase III [Ezakiella sp.]|nr:PolC-type DNA polymerase III [Ezakiella sp.]